MFTFVWKSVQQHFYFLVVELIFTKMWTHCVNWKKINTFNLFIKTWLFVVFSFFLIFNCRWKRFPKNCQMWLLKTQSSGEPSLHTTGEGLLAVAGELSKFYVEGLRDAKSLEIKKKKQETWNKKKTKWLFKNCFWFVVYRHGNAHIQNKYRQNQCRYSNI